MAATRLPFSITLSAVTAIAPPTYMAEREATAPNPGTSRAESPEVTVTAAGRDAEPARRDAAEHRLMSLTAGAGADADSDGIATGKRDARGFFRKRAGDLQIAADADAAQLAGFFCRLPARGKAGIIADHKRALEDRRKVAAVIGVTEGSRVGNFVGHNQVAPAQFGGIDAGLVGGGIDQPLHQVAH